MKNYLLIVCIPFLLIACSPKVSSQSDLKLVSTIKLNISEPSGITAYKNHLYIVSDQTGNIYKTNLKGKVLQKIKTNYSDVEGIAFNPNKSQFLIVDEAKRTLITLNSDGSVVKKVKIKGKQDHHNSGLEGIAYNASKNKIYVLNEKSPKQLLEVSKKGEILNKLKLDFSKDLSGLCFDEKTNTFWIVSDESKHIYNISKKGKLLKKYKIAVEKAEGITVFKNRIYIVSDSLNKLFVFEMDD